jgi:hypothetical protein
MSYTLINPLQQVLTFEEYKKALKKAEEFMEKHQFSTEEKKPRGRPKGTIKKPKPETSPEPKKRGRPPKAKPETPAPKAPVGRPAKEPNDFNTLFDAEFDTNDFGTLWFEDPETITKILNKFFKQPENQFIRIKDGILEKYEDKAWVKISGIGKQTPLDIISIVLLRRLIESHKSPADSYNLDKSKPQGKERLNKLVMFLKEYVKDRFAPKV